MNFWIAILLILLSTSAANASETVGSEAPGRLPAKAGDLSSLDQQLQDLEPWLTDCAQKIKMALRDLGMVHIKTAGTYSCLVETTGKVFNPEVRRSVVGKEIDALVILAIRKASPFGAHASPLPLQNGLIIQLADTDILGSDVRVSISKEPLLSEVMAPPPTKGGDHPWTDKERIQRFCATTGRRLSYRWGLERFQSLHDLSCIVKVARSRQILSFRQEKASEDFAVNSLFAELIKGIEYDTRVLGLLESATIEINLESYPNRTIRQSTEKQQTLARTAKHSCIAPEPLRAELKEQSPEEQLQPFFADCQRRIQRHLQGQSLQPFSCTFNFDSKGEVCALRITEETSSVDFEQAVVSAIKTSNLYAAAPKDGRRVLIQERGLSLEILKNHDFRIQVRLARKPEAENK